MSDILWSEKYRPKRFDEIVGQERVVGRLERLVESKNLPHILINGSKGVGKTMLVLALANELYGDLVADNFTILNASDFFDLGRSYLDKEARFSRFYKRDKPVISIFKDSIKKYASILPFNADYKLIFIDNAENLRKDAQDALRRIMERYSNTCRFIFATTSKFNIISPIRSRCVDIFVPKLDKNLVSSILLNILDKEGIKVTKDGVESINNELSNDIEFGIDVIQFASREYGLINSDAIRYSIKEIGRSELDILIDKLFEQNNADIKKEIEKITLIEGYDSKEIIESTIKKIKNIKISERKKAIITLLIADIEHDIVRGRYDFIHLERLFLNLKIFLFS
ncbi:MAG: AAA family ATPase [Candidatus Methanoliparum thermophilum]|uniref:Replication factor C small subunit n=1 Tax=Methanoliparum thermophilum TaxID=2491083 RepID=A0A520KTN1_METT2|nr:AAA family ATPase [Candidatus Methanoliparum sp. LAM-1]RZN65435.1 MAG: AAA family ATPase [Candidatus Methanoliparum thermophilum]BDC35476.1 replication protein C [Candidatus Methanoliparum sp. LAM-1]